MDNGVSKNGGPSWKWLTGVLLGILLTVMGGLLGWIALTVQSTSIELGRLAWQTQATGSQVSALNDRFDRQDVRIEQLSAQLGATTDLTNNNADWIAAHVLADRAIHRAEQAKHSNRK